MLQDFIQDGAYTCFKAVDDNVCLEVVSLMKDDTFKAKNCIYMMPTISVLLQPLHRPGLLLPATQEFVVHKAAVVSSLSCKTCNDNAIASARQYMKSYWPQLHVHDFTILNQFRDRHLKQFDTQQLDIARLHFVVLVQYIGDPKGLVPADSGKPDDVMAVAALSTYAKYIHQSSSHNFAVSSTRKWWLAKCFMLMTSLQVVTIILR